MTGLNNKIDVILFKLKLIQLYLYSDDQYGLKVLYRKPDLDPRTNHSGRKICLLAERTLEQDQDYIQ